MHHPASGLAVSVENAPELPHRPKSALTPLQLRVLQELAASPGRESSALTPDGVTPAFFLRAMVKLSSDESPGAIG